MTIKLSKSDINAIANARYYKKQGLRLIVAMVAVIAVLYILVTWLNVIPNYVFYIVMGISVFVLILLYDKGQRKLFKRYWKRLQDEGIVTKDELEEDELPQDGNGLK